MTDQSKIMAMNFMGRLHFSIQYTRPAAAPMVTMKMIQLSIEYGMSHVSPIGFTYYGQHVATCGDIEEGCRYVHIARKLLDRRGLKEFAGDVITTGTQLLTFVKPIQVTLEYHTEGYKIAMAAGDMQGAMQNSVFYCAMAFWGSSNLIHCKDHFSRTCRLLEQHGHLNILAHIIQMVKNIQLLIGITDGQAETPMSNATTIQLEEILQITNHQGSIAFNAQKMNIHFMFREYDDMKVFAEQFFSFSHDSWVFHFGITEGNFFGGLVAFWVYRQTNEPTWAERGSNAKVAMKKWAESSQHNFQHRVYLLEAEEAFCNNDAERAQLLYEKAVSTAREHQ